MSTRAQVSIGDQVSTGETAPPFGAVRNIRPHELIVDIEGYGDVAIEARAVVRVHDAKVIVDASLLPEVVQRAIASAHHQETQ